MASATVERADQSDGQKRYLIIVTDGDDELSRRVAVPDGEAVRPYLIGQARKLYRIIRSRRQSDLDNQTENTKWETLTPETPVNDATLRR